MTVRSAVIVLVLCTLRFSPLQAQQPSTVQVEVNYLLSYVETSGCSFYRNGSWYGGARARAHLQIKYDYLAARNLVGSADEFIDKGASKSSFSGKPYKIRCGTGAEVESGPWFHDVLVRFRAAARAHGDSRHW
jgi:Family of unknown function (DUF5329)